MSQKKDVSDTIHKPAWLKVKASFGKEYSNIRNLVAKHRLHTVCQEASCPNIGQCFTSGTATFIIMGDKCTRNCRFCDVITGKPSPPDCDEPTRVAAAIAEMNLKFAVITSVTRDDLADGGAEIFHETVRQIKQQIPQCKVELLIPDLKGDKKSLARVISANPEVLAHNLETVPDLYTTVRPQAIYSRSLDVIRYIAEAPGKIITKSGIMIGLGESENQIIRVMEDTADCGCDIFTIGQYLSPSKSHLPVIKYYTPEEFANLRGWNL